MPIQIVYDCSRGDQDVNLRAAVQFEGFVNRLDEVDQLDALKVLANTYSALRHWDKVMVMTKELGKKHPFNIIIIMSEPEKTGYKRNLQCPYFHIFYILMCYVQ